MIYPCFVDQRQRCKAAVRSSHGYTLPRASAPGSLGHSTQPGRSRVSATNMTMFPPHNKPKESNEKPVESDLFPTGSGYSLLLRATDLGIV